MWKRSYTLLVALVMVFLLCACSSQKVNIEQRIQEGVEQLSSVENCHLVLRIVINPQLDLYLNDEGVVLKAEAGNKDGESLLAEVDLAGLSYHDAVTAVLATAEKQNHLPKNAVVQIAVLASADGPLSMEETQQLEQVVADYSQQLKPAVDQSVVVAADCGADLVQIENLENGDVFYSFFSSMERIREICYGADGSYTEWVYENRQTGSIITVKADGTRWEDHLAYEGDQLVCYSRQTPDGLEESTYYNNGATKLHKRVMSDGSFEEMEYYENGNQKTHKMLWSDGSSGEVQFDENGVKTYSNEICEDYSHVAYYYPNGNFKSSLVTYSDGRIQEQQFYENGGIKYSKDSFPDGTVWEHYYDEDGTKIDD